MHPNPSSLDPRQLSQCLRATAGDERSVQVDFLRYLDAFDATEAFRELGHDSLWSFCLKELHLREGSAGRRIGAMRALRDFPELEAPLRDGRLSLTTVVTLRSVLTASNTADMVRRAAYKTDLETRELVAALRPMAPPREGIRRLPGAVAQVSLDSAGAATNGSMDGPTEGETAPPDGVSAEATRGSTAKGAAPTETGGPGDPGVHDPTSATRCVDPGAQHDGASGTPARSEDALGHPKGRPAASETVRRPALDPVSEAHWSMRVTIDAQFRADLEALRGLLGHKIPNGDLAAVLHEAVLCGIEKHGKRRGAVKPARPRTRRRTSPPAAARPRSRVSWRASIPAPVRREVWARDGGQCTYVSRDGKRCESRHRLEFDHIDPSRKHLTPTARDLRLHCATHNLLRAEQHYGREHMKQFRRGGRRSTRTLASESSVRTSRPGQRGTSPPRKGRGASRRPS
jgi:5-methylcytosine-specific restriction endonuclease McrA